MRVAEHLRHVGMLPDDIEVSFDGTTDGQQRSHKSAKKDIIGSISTCAASCGRVSKSVQDVDTITNQSQLDPGWYG